MRPQDRIVVTLPLTELWSDEGPVDAQRKRDLSPGDVRALLRQGPVRFVVADVGKSLAWIHPKRSYAFWKTELRERLIDPSADEIHLHQYPGEYGYMASEWASEKERIVVFEKVH